MTEDEIMRMAAEPETPAKEATDAAPEGTDSDGYTGRCIGGPWDTSDADVRYPKGFLLVHKPEKAVWIYDRQPDGTFKCRNAKPELLDDNKRMKAAEGAEYDIRVLDPKAVEPAVKP